MKIQDMKDNELMEYYEKRLPFVQDKNEINFINWAMELMKRINKD